jgi:hypothetical protein
MDQEPPNGQQGLPAMLGYGRRPGLVRTDRLRGDLLATFALLISRCFIK